MTVPPSPSPFYPPTVPHEHGMLDVGDGNLVYWECCGNPDGKPAVFVHGGPGSGCRPGGGRGFDPERYRIVIFDQRGCGRSQPHASDPTTSLETNTTWHLVADMELLREHLGIERWLLHGGSWGSTLTLAYAQAHPRRVSEIVLVAVTTSTRRELDWLYRGVARFFPEEWERFRSVAADLADDVPAHEPTSRRHDLVATYAQLVNHTDAAVRNAATDAWCRWETTVLSLEPNRKASGFGDGPADKRLALVRICSHFYANAAWLDEGALIRGAGRLTGIPGVLIHGRQDLSCPAETAYDLARAWPGAELHIVDDGGHQGSALTAQHILAALDRFADR